jgi:predicted nuclease with RNAse H fold
VYVGIDVSSRALHCVAIDAQGEVVDARVVAPDDLESLSGTYADAYSIAIDAPSDLSTRPHLDDPDFRPGAKFRPGRCAEIALGLDYGLWVPWVAPHKPLGGWMEVGRRVFTAFRDSGRDPIEVYPHAAFGALRRPLPSKQSAAGIQVRADILAERGVRLSGLKMWSHDGLDALIGAVVARDHANGEAIRVSCGHDSSAIWLPAGSHRRRA